MSAPREERVRMVHGSGGAAMRRLVSEVFVGGLGGGPTRAGDIGLAEMDDGAALRVGDRWLVVTTDSHVVHPIFFPGGDIGRLAVCGTVNDLAMMGAHRAPRAHPGRGDRGRLLPQRPRARARLAARRLRRGGRRHRHRGHQGDGQGPGRRHRAQHRRRRALADRVVSDAGLRPGDRLLVTGTVGDHGFAVMAVRHALDLEGALASDVAPLNGLIRAALAAGGASIVAMKDPTRGGLSSALHEMAGKAGVGVVLDEQAVPVRREVRAASELLGIDPLLVANEGKAVLGVRPAAAAAVLAALRAHPLGRDAAIVGTVVAERPGSVVLDTGFGRRLLIEIEGDPLPRIC